jgi:hypothetical protein
VGEVLQQELGYEVLVLSICGRCHVVRGMRQMARESMLW